MHPIDFLFLAYCVYVPFLAVLYLIEIWVMLKPGTPFKGSFYVMFVATAFVDLLMVGVTIHELRMEFFPLFNDMFANYDCQWCSRTRITISLICPMAQDFLNCFVAFNRLTAIVYSTSHKNIWRKLLPFAIVFSYVVPTAIFAWPGIARLKYGATIYKKIQLPTYFVYLVTSDTTVLPWFVNHLVSVAGMAITSIVIVVMYTISAFGLRKLVGSKETAQQEKTLLKFGIIQFALAIPSIFMQVNLVFHFLPADWLALSLYMYGLLIDLKFFGAAVSMIVVNKSFRLHLLNSLRLIRSSNKADKVVSVTVLSNLPH